MTDPDVRDRDGKTYRVYNYDGEIRNAQAPPDVQAPEGHLGSGPDGPSGPR